MSNLLLAFSATDDSDDDGHEDDKDNDKDSENVRLGEWQRQRQRCRNSSWTRKLVRKRLLRLAICQKAKM